ncbi:MULTISPECIES: hypothetical protein [unclassified Corynebacterium]|uniref:hypothetical protein n=1 Tax=unclassified Corynebacterium TaxID=2624378 RepID=UPI0030ACD08D
MAATVLDDVKARTSSVGTATPTRPSSIPAKRTRPRRSTYRGRFGSQQVVSVRGRRLTNTTKDRSSFNFALGAVLIAVAGIIVAMVLSGLSTSQSLDLNAAREREVDLQNSVEVLERDVAYLQSTGEIARRAGEMDMVHHDQPAILATGEDGVVREVRPGTGEYQKMIDLNGGSDRPHAPTSDPAETKVVPGMQAPTIQEANPAGQLPATAPYAPQGYRTPAPAPAPAPAQAPAPAEDNAAPAGEAPLPAPAP